GVMGAGGDPGALAQLEHRLLRSRPVPAGTRDADLRLRRDGLVDPQRALDGAGEPGSVLAAEGGERRDRAGVARRVAPRALELGRADDHLLGELAERRVRPARDEPDGAVEGSRRLERERRRALVRDADEE